MNTELFNLAAKYKAACDDLDAAQDAYKAASKAMSAADNALGEAKTALVKALGNDGAVVVNDECFVSDSGYIKIRRLAGWIGVDLAKPNPETDADGFIVWNGGGNPVPGKRVCYKLRLGERSIRPSEDLFWAHFGHGGDIVAYKVVG